MQTGRSEDQESPLGSTHLRMRALDWDLIRAEHLGPAAIRAASTSRTHDRTRPMLHQRQKALVNQAPSTHDPKRTSVAAFCCDAQPEPALGPAILGPQSLAFG